MRRPLPLVLLLLAACPHAPPVAPPPAPPPPLPRIPAHCEQPLSGTYHHRDDTTFGFELSDDGTTVRATAFRKFGQTRQAISSAASRIELRRTPEGFRGEARAEQEVIPGALSCPVIFPYEVTACSESSITLRGLPAVDVKIERSPTPDGGFALTCGAPEPTSTGFTENVLEREVVDGGVLELATDAGLRDAGESPGYAGVPVDAGAGATDAGLAPSDAGLASPDAGPEQPPPARDGGSDAGIVEA